MNRARIGRRSGAAAAALAAVALLAVSASPASATSNKTISYGDRGYMEFIDDGDVFKLCDIRADGHGVDGYLMRRDGILGGNFQQLWVITNLGGNGTCIKKAYNIGNSYDYQMQIWWRGDYADGGVSSDWFNE